MHEKPHYFLEINAFFCGKLVTNRLVDAFELNEHNSKIKLNSESWVPEANVALQVRRGAISVLYRPVGVNYAFVRTFCIKTGIINSHVFDDLMRIIYKSKPVVFQLMIHGGKDIMLVKYSTRNGWKLESSDFEIKLIEDLSRTFNVPIEELDV